MSTLTEKHTKLKETFHQFMQVTISNHNSTKASIRNMEMQIGQITKKLEEKSDKSFGTNTEVNLKEECRVSVSVNVKKVELVRKEKKLS
ncbi:hypothetical protein VIGAN_01396500 [Vigna angularis var. angularis]|uniref:Uncharacterized protein n=1 Tax=Vigna angularis var. angularis TaxID=157739 RepID=A0A0S3R699_PHAAN|nr:hypothetical protein VIGAN_01396500 [Vigna angularis var. angularis]